MTLVSSANNIGSYIELILRERSFIYTGHTQNNGADYYAFGMETAPFFCVFPVL
jgi:hypothetical protein